jgi:Tat protein secretion system quality control protein TatD with DNase activity
MATQEGDQSKVATLARTRPDRIVPAFGYHPWWAHRISLNAPSGTTPDHTAHYRALFLPDSSPPPSAELEAAFVRLLPTLPQPISLADILADIRAHLNEFPSAMLGEVGIDRAARIPFKDGDASSEEGNHPRALSPFSTPFAHQLAVLEAQLALAVEMRRNVSLHSVKAPAQTLALFDRMAATHGTAWFAISIDVHSCTLSPEVWRDIEVRPFLLHSMLPPSLSIPLGTSNYVPQEEEECLLMDGTEALSERILIVFDSHQWPLAESPRTHPCMCTQSPPCRVRLP